MRFLRGLTFFLCVCTGTNTLAFNNAKFQLRYINNRIIIEIPSSKNKILNFVFDSGSNDFLVDSNTATEYSLNNNQSKSLKLDFNNGFLVARSFFNHSLFKDKDINNLYITGKIIKIDPKKLNIPFRIDGVLGVNKAIEKLILTLDFEHQIFEISSVLKDEGYYTGYKLRLLDSNNGYAGELSDFYKRLSATNAHFYLSKSCIFNTNILFDTGCNTDFVLLTTLNLDSIILHVGKPYVTIRKQTGMANDISVEYKFNADSIIINNKIIKSKQEMYMSRANRITNLIFGRENTFGLVGAPFMKHFKKIVFDYPQREMLLI